MEKELITRIKTEKKLNQSLRMLGVPFPLSISFLIISGICIDSLHYYSAIIIFPFFLLLNKIAKSYKNGNDHYIRDTIIKAKTKDSLYKDFNSILNHITDEK